MSKYRPEVSDYMTVTGNDPLHLEQQVREMLLDDWQPLGGGFTGVEHGHNQFREPITITVWCQTMVKRALVQTDLPKKETKDPKQIEIEKAWASR